MPIRLHCNELRALCLTINDLCRTAEISALLLKYVLIVYIWPENAYYMYMYRVERGKAENAQFKIICRVPMRKHICLG